MGCSDASDPIKTRRLLGQEQAEDSHPGGSLEKLSKEDRFQDLRVAAEDQVVRLRATVAVLKDSRQARSEIERSKGCRIMVSHIKVETETIAMLATETIAGTPGQRSRQPSPSESQERSCFDSGAVRHDADRDQVFSSVASLPVLLG